MGESYSCTFTDCGKLFTRAYELKKHKATHEDPGSVFYCSQCSFFTLQKKNLKIHVAIHTGEKVHQCPDIIPILFSGPAIFETRCEFRTHDPAALTKHRKKVHGYIPPGRSRSAKSALANPPYQKQDGNTYAYPRPYQRPDSCRLPSHVFTKANNPTNTRSAGYTSTPTDASNTDVFSPFLWQANMDVYAQSMDQGPFDAFGCGSSISSNTTFTAPNGGMGVVGLGTLYDRTQNVTSYSASDVPGMTYLPESLHVDPSSAAGGSAMQTGREGCLCPEWMVEAGIEGWDQSVLESHKEFYVFDA